jgi:hypothetical protein
MSRHLIHQYDTEFDKIIQYGGSKQETSPTIHLPRRNLAEPSGRGLLARGFGGLAPR